MSNFNSQINELIFETESNIDDLEKMIFTGRYTFLEKDFKVLSKQSVVILYSLWEGFVQEVFNLFLQEVDKSVDSYFELKDSFMVSQIEKNFKQFNEYPQKLKGKSKFHESYFSLITQSKHKIDLRVDVKNNVELDILNELLDIHGANQIQEHWKDKGYTHPNLTVKDILKKLLYVRNNTAHGNKIMTDVIISQADFEEYKKLILNLIYEIGRLLIECIENKSYLKSS